MGEKQNEQRQAAQKAWDEWHARVRFADDHYYFPMMPPLWEVAFAHGAIWAEGRKGDE